MRPISEAAAEQSGRSRIVLEYALTTKRLVDTAKQPGFTAASWAPLAELVDVDGFERIGNFKEVIASRSNYSENYQAYITQRKTQQPEFFTYLNERIQKSNV